MSTVVLRNAEIINEGRRLRADVLIRAGRIERIGTIRDASVAQVAEEMIADKTNRGRGDNWIKDLRNFLLGTAAPRLKKPIMAVTLEDLEETLTKYSGRTRNNKIGLLVQLFNYAKGRYLPENE